MSVQRFMRNADLIDQKKLNNLSIIGGGGIGSHLIPSLSIMGWKNVELIDYDILEEHNRSTTCYPISAIGKYKVDAAREEWYRYADRDQIFTPIPKRYRANKMDLKENVIVCTDTMESRLEVYNKWIEMDKRGWFVDLRMSALGYEIITASKAYDNYEEHWQPSNSIADDPCTAKHTIFCGGLVAYDGLAQVYLLLQKTLYYAYINCTILPKNYTHSEIVCSK